MSLLLARAAKNHRSSGTLYSSVVLADSPIGYWRLGETGSTAADSTSSGFNGTYVSCTQGATSLITHNGGNLAVQGNGTSSQITVGAVPTLYNLSRSFSIEAWIKPANVGSGVLSGIWSSGYLGFCFRRSGSSLQLLRDYSSVLGTLSAGFVAGVRYHVGVEVSSTGTATLYVNGVSIGTINASSYSYSGSYVRLGADGSNSTLVETFLDGILDEVAVYNYAIGSAKWSSHYAAGA